MSEVSKRTFSDVQKVEQHEVGRVFRDLGADYFYVGKIETVTTHVTTETETVSAIELPVRPQVIVHVPEQREWSPPGYGLDFLEPV